MCGGAPTPRSPGPVSEQFITSGPLYGRACPGAPDLPRWRRLGEALTAFLRLDPAEEATAVRVHHYYLPVYLWVARQVAEVRAAHPEPRAVVVGLNCPQGGGKTTLCDALQHLLGLEELTCVALSVDDFYLTRPEQIRVAEANAGNRLLQGRGNPGTHDVALGRQTLQAMLRPAGTAVAVPRYDKSAFQGKGDRLPAEQWPLVRAPVHVVLFEGWCLGFRPVAPEAIVDPDLHVVNSFLAEQCAQWYPLLDAFLVLQVADHRWVYEWRLEAEHAMLAQGKSGMTDAEVAQFCSRYMPSYEQYLPGLYTDADAVVPGRQLTLRIDKDRRPVS